MPAPVRKIRRRVIGLGLLALISGLLASVVLARQSQNLASSFQTGYLLLTAFVFLALFQLRKKLSFLPQLGSAQFWMQAHIYVGLGTFALFALHIGWRIPNGSLELFLAGLYLLVAGSGLYGLYITRVIPRRLANVGDECIYEQIPFLRQQVARQAQQLVASVVDGSDTLARFYVNRMAPFLESPRAVAYLVRPSMADCRRLQAEIRQLDRNLSPEEQKLGPDLIELIQRKDNLDYHQALQGRLKFWLFAHVGLTYSLLLVTLFHAALAHAFHGGAV